MTDEPLKVGDEVAIPRWSEYGGRNWRLTKIINVLPSGVASDGNIAINPNMRIRGSGMYASRVTQEIREALECEQLRDRVDLRDLSLDQLRRIVAIVEE